MLEGIIGKGFEHIRLILTQHTETLMDTDIYSYSHVYTHREHTHTQQTHSTQTAHRHTHIAHTLMDTHTL